MDSTDSDPMSHDSVFNPNWLKKKRYEDEHCSLSPPDDGTFFPLRFGTQRTKPHESMYDRINKELGLSVEGSKGQEIRGLSLAQASKDDFSIQSQAQLLLRPSGIFLETRKEHGSDGTEVSVVTDPLTDSHKILFPSNILEKQKSDSLQSLIESHDTTQILREDVDTLVRKASSGRPTKKISMNLAHTIDRDFLESVQNLKIESPHTQQQPVPTCPMLPTTGAGSLVQPLPNFPISENARDRRRKTSAPPSLNPMLMDTQKASNYFFTGSLFAPANNSSLTGSTQNLTAAHHVTEIVAEESSAVSEPATPIKQLEGPGSQFTLAQTTSLMEAKSTEAAELEPKPKMGRRRPRASALREMNFLAPQSM